MTLSIDNLGGGGGLYDHTIKKTAQLARHCACARVFREGREERNFSCWAWLSCTRKGAWGRRFMPMPSSLVHVDVPVHVLCCSYIMSLFMRMRLLLERGDPDAYPIMEMCVLWGVGLDNLNIHIL